MARLGRTSTTLVPSVPLLSRLRDHEVARWRRDAEKEAVFESPADAAGVKQTVPVAPWHARRLEWVCDDALCSIIRS